MSQPPTLLIVDDDAEIRYSLHRVLSRNYRVITASNGQEGISLAKKEEPHAIFLDNRMEGMSGMETLQHLRSGSPHSMIILMTAYGTTQTAIEAMKFGAFDYIIKPFDLKKVLSLAANAVNAHNELLANARGYIPLLDSEQYKEGIVGSSEIMQEVFKKIGQVAASDATVLITGESGTGKELVARCIWQHSLRAAQPFLAVNCAAIPENLIESELFGHEKGSFTGATNQRTGKFELCDHGTLFLDEIGDMALATQTKILRTIQDGEIQRVGGSKSLYVDVRLIAATNKDLEKMIADRTFREDLYYRLNVIRIRLPALRERREDIPQLVDFMLQRLGKEKKTRVRQISRDALQLLTAYHWPGNVRELENAIQRSAIVAQGETILPKDLPPEFRNSQPAVPVAVSSVEEIPPAEPVPVPSTENPLPAPASPPLPPPAPVPMADQTEGLPQEDMFVLLYQSLRKQGAENILEHLEKHLIQLALRETAGNQVKTAAIVGITRATLRKRIDEWQLRY